MVKEGANWDHPISSRKSLHFATIILILNITDLHHCMPYATFYVLAC